MKIKSLIVAAVTLSSVSFVTSFAQSSINVENLYGHTVEISCATDETSHLIGALFSNDGFLVETQIEPVSDTKRVTFNFSNSIDNCDLKLLLWNENLTALTEPCERKALNPIWSEADTNGIYAVTDRGSSPVTVHFNNSVSDMTIDFDIMVETIPNGDAIVGVIPQSGDVSGIGVGFCSADDTNQRYLPSPTVPVPPFELVNTIDFKNRWIHISMNYENGSGTVTFSDTLDGTIYVDNQPLTIIGDVGTNKAINALSFGLVYTGSVSYQPDEPAKFYVKNLTIGRR